MSAAASIESPYDTAPGAAIAAIATHEGPVFVDLDETLYLRNSTEDFIDLARPGLLAVLLLRVVEVIKPWRWTGGELARDVWRVRLICKLFPWTRGRWVRRVSGLAREFGNQPLLNVVKAHALPPIILTLGFRPIVAPLVAALGLPEARIIAARLDSFEDRCRGKLECAIDTLGQEAVGHGLLITDSTQDLPLLHACRQPLRTIWPEARYRRALSHVYLPGEYLTQVKRPGEHYIRRGILQEDFAFWVLASIALAPNPWTLIPALLLLLASFWTIYERGYVDNDMIGARHEEEPKLNPAYWEAPVATPRVQPWIWAFALGACGVILLRWPRAPAAWDYLKWAAALAGCYGWFKLYNRLDKSTRVWLFAGLQLARAAVFTVLVPVPPIGAMALGANALARWVPYYVYRFAGTRWPGQADPTLIRLMYFIVLAALLGVALGWSSLFNWTALMLLGWNLYRSRQQLREVGARATRVDQGARAP
ncbi:MAG: hypothetical protein JWM63_3122 [Gammaproteobacteria bacterium]|jgi:hypothetical protein|nr:hypothetical protein [Gammaproteobacteria bacterium]